MNPQTTDTLDFSRAAAIYCVRRIAALAVILLLAGYLIFNRPFAQLGFPPVYVGELVLGFALLASLFDFKQIFIAPLKHSWAMRLVAAFMFYGVARVGIDLPWAGIDAPRDGVICLYAIAAFLAPWLLSRPTPEPGFDSAARTLRLFLLIVSPAATLWALLIASGIMAAPAGVKVDFLSLSAAVAMVCWLYKFIEIFCGQRLVNVSFILRNCGALFLFSMALMTIYIMPTRALWLAPLIAIAFLIPKLTFNPKMILSMSLILPLLVVMALNAPFRRTSTTLEKIEALADPDDRHFKTREGQQAAHSVKWRLVFWRHCAEETLRRAPIFGLGFGTNLTDLMRGTPDWPMYEDSQNALKYGSPNRHPHSAHVTVFARLGITGAMLWLALVTTVFVQGLKNCRRARPDQLNPGVDTALFWSMTTILGVWSIYVLAMSFGVVLENPFGGILFWTLTGVLIQPHSVAHIQGIS